MELYGKVLVLKGQNTLQEQVYKMTDITKVNENEAIIEYLTPIDNVIQAKKEIALSELSISILGDIDYEDTIDLSIAPVESSTEIDFAEALLFISTYINQN